MKNKPLSSISELIEVGLHVKYWIFSEMSGMLEVALVKNKHSDYGFLRAGELWLISRKMMKHNKKYTFFNLCEQTMKPGDKS